VSARELILCGLPGPTHNFAGLAMGNLASKQHGLQTSRPRLAALQSLDLMRQLDELGLPVAVMPPQERPNLEALRGLGFTGDDEAILKRSFEEAPELFRACYSSSAMWVANAATVSPAADTADGKVHFTPANLNSQFHRALETPATAAALKRIFPEGEHFTHHPPLWSCQALRDEGAANHLRFAADHGSPGLEVFVWGDSPTASFRPKKYQSRQALAASEAIARLHGVKKRTLFLQQNPEAIDAGVFHNDVISVSHHSLLLTHAEAFAGGDACLTKIRHAYPELQIIEIKSEHLTVHEAVSTYLFNSQIVDLLDGSYALIAPQDVEQHPAAKTCAERILSEDNPISQVIYLPLRESMKNGGGPACLRLRVALSEDALEAVHPGLRYSADLDAQLRDWITRNYREELALADLWDAQLVRESRAALAELNGLLKFDPET